MKFKSLLLLLLLSTNAYSWPSYMTNSSLRIGPFYKTTNTQGTVLITDIINTNTATTYTLFTNQASTNSTLQAEINSNRVMIVTNKSLQSSTNLLFQGNFVAQTVTNLWTYETLTNQQFQITTNLYLQSLTNLNFESRLTNQQYQITNNLYKQSQTNLNFHTSKVDKVIGATNLNIAVLDATGNIVDGGKTIEEVAAEATRILTYYVWGSSNGPVTNTKLASLASPALLTAYTNTATSITNGQKVGAYSILNSELPDNLLAGGIANVHASLYRTGNSSERTIKATISVVESDGTTVVAVFTNSMIPSIVVPEILDDVLASIPVSYSVSLTNSRMVKLDFYALSGWTGAETIYSVSQDGYLTRFELPASPAGVFALESEVLHLSGGTMTGTLNVTNLNVTGTLTFENTVWDDLLIPSLSLIDPQGPVDPARFVQVTNALYALEFVAGNVGIGRTQMSHQYKTNTMLYPHIHTVHTNSVARTNTWGVWISWGRIARALTNHWYGEVTITNPPTTNGVMIHTLTSLGAITNSAGTVGPSTVYGVIVTNKTTSTSSGVLLDVDIHYEKNTFGSDTETPAGI